MTIHLSVDFLHMARVGEWVMGEAKVTRATRDVAFVEARAHVGGTDVIRGSGVFKLMRRHGQAFSGPLCAPRALCSIAGKAKALYLALAGVIRGVAQPGSASGLGPEGRRFKSSRPDQRRA